MRAEYQWREECQHVNVCTFKSTAKITLEITERKKVMQFDNYIANDIAHDIKMTFQLFGCDVLVI